MKTIIRLTILALAVTWLPARPAPADENDDRREELRQRFEQRYAKLQEFKEAGSVGETHEGFVEAVKPGVAGEDHTELVDAENTDRRELYKLLAEKEKTTPDKVAERNAERNFRKAKPGEFLKGKDGQWRKKE
ncbi:MAG: YdbL family protein [Actinomycetota bacterium]